jgi:nucleotide-binding universal stress UspA family protein
MVQHLIVPTDGSDAAWSAADVAFDLARRCDATVEVVEFVSHDDDVEDTGNRLAARLRQHDTAGADVRYAAMVAHHSVAAALADLVAAQPDAVVVMASHGRGRSAALMGSVTEDLLRLEFGPLLVVGPRCHSREISEPRDFSGPIIATVDGSHDSESALALAVAWGIELQAEPWIVQVTDPDSTTGAGGDESAYPARLAGGLTQDSGHPVQFEVLHGSDIPIAISEFAKSASASMIVATTHGRSGLSRFVTGSTAAAIVHHAPCPVLLLRPPHLAG